MLSTFRRRKLSHLFHVYDVDGNGFVEVDDFERVIHVLAASRGWAVDGPAYARLRRAYMSQWQMIGVAAEPGEGGRVRPDAWLALWSGIVVASFDERLRTLTDLLFDCMDADGNHLISLDESRAWFAAHGAPAEADHVFPACDLNGDGQISREEWEQLVEAFFFSDDPEARGNSIFGRLPSGC